MKALALPSGTTHVPFQDLPHLMADALWPVTHPDDPRWNYGGARLNLESLLVLAVKNGVLPVKDPLTFGPHPFPQGNALASGLVAVDDLRRYAAGHGISVVMAETKQADQLDSATTETPAQRRARRLDLFEIEEKRMKRGALQRLASSERVDRSNLGKEILKAKKERAEEKRAGQWVITRLPTEKNKKN